MSPASQFTVEHAWVQDWERLARALHIPRERLRITKEGADVERLWVETPINDAWTSAALLAVQNGQIVVAEVRVFPNEPNRLPGVWSAALLGSKATAPPGGLTRKVYRKVRVGEPRKHAREALRRLHRYLRRPDTPKSAFYLAAAPRPRHQRRGGRPDHFYAVLAMEYEQRSDTAVSRRPVADLAARYRVSRGRMRDMIREARERGLLTFFVQGRAGGTATDRARAILNATTQQRRGKRRRKSR